LKAGINQTFHLQDKYDTLNTAQKKTYQLELKSCNAFIAAKKLQYANKKQIQDKEKEQEQAKIRNRDKLIRK
jgi:hypothetical protein